MYLTHPFPPPTRVPRPQNPGLCLCLSSGAASPASRLRRRHPRPGAAPDASTHLADLNEWVPPTRVDFHFIESRDLPPGGASAQDQRIQAPILQIKQTRFLSGSKFLLPPGWPGQLSFVPVGRGKETCLLNAWNINPPRQAGSQGASLRWVELVSPFGHLYARPIPNAKLEVINLPPGNAALACRPRALPPTKVRATLGPLSPHLRLSFAQHGGQVDSEPLRLGRAVVLPADPGAQGLLPAGKSPTRPPAAVRPPAGATAASPALTAWGPRPRPAPPRLASRR